MEKSSLFGSMANGNLEEFCLLGASRSKTTGPGRVEHCRFGSNAFDSGMSSLGRSDSTDPAAMAYTRASFSTESVAMKHVTGSDNNGPSAIGSVKESGERWKWRTKPPHGLEQW